MYMSSWYFSDIRYESLFVSAKRQLDEKGLPQYHQLKLSIMGFPDRDYTTPRELAERLQITPHAGQPIKLGTRLSDTYPNMQDGIATELVVIHKLDADYICLNDA